MTGLWSLSISLLKRKRPVATFSSQHTEPTVCKQFTQFHFTWAPWDCIIVSRIINFYQRNNIPVSGIWP